MCEHEGTLPTPDILAYTMSEAVADQEGDTAQEYLIAFMDELLTLEPGLREHFSDTLLTELKEELIQREDAKLVHATVTLIESIEQDWRNQQ